AEVARFAQDRIGRVNGDAIMPPPVVSVQTVTHRYKDVVALDGLSLDIPSGIRVGIVGPDGVGKSTLLALIAGSKKLQEGNLIVLDGDIGEMRHRRAVGPRV